MKKILLFLLFTSINFTFSQYVPEWVQLHSQSNISLYSSSLCSKDASGNIFAANSYFNGNDADVITTKYNSDGTFAWSKQYGSTGIEYIDFVSKVITDNSGNVIVMGNANSDTYNDYKVFILKYNTTGTLISFTEFKRPENPITFSTDVVTDAAGNIYITGQLDNYQTFIDSAFTAKFSPSLNFMWIQTTKDTNVSGNVARTLKMDPSGNIFVSGISGGSIVIKKYNNSGSLIWSRKNFLSNINYSQYFYPSIFLDNNQNLYASITKYETTGNDSAKTVLLKYNSTGTLQWYYNYNISTYGIEIVKNIFSDNSNIYLHVSDDVSTYLLQFNQNGIQQWQKSIDHPVSYMNLDNSNNIIATGYKVAYHRNEMCMEKYSPSGSLDASYSYSYNGTGFDQAVTFFNTNDSKLILGGSHNYSVILLKLTPSVSQFFSSVRNNLSKPILDNQYTYDTISIPAMQLPPYTQVKNVYINIDTILHTAAGDLNIMLVHEGITDTLIYQRGGTLDNFIGTKLRDTSVTSICASGNTPFTGYYKPCWPLNQFNNLSAPGPWILKIYDRRSPDTGFLKAWSITIIYDIPIGVNIISSEIPRDFSLSQNYPNPFNPSTKIKFSLPGNSYTKLIIYDILGKEIETLVNNDLKAGIYETEYNASKLSSGIYFYKLITDDFVESKKMVLIK